MAFSPDTPEPRPAELADLSALADGTLEPARCDEVRARIEASPQLTALYERERRVVELLHETRSTDRAPERLRARIEADRGRAARPSRRARLRYGGALATALAAVALAFVLILPAGTLLAPSVSQAAALASRGVTAAAPVADPGDPLRLGADIEDVYFPNWAASHGWKAVGRRFDRINGRPAMTVFYERDGVQIAYTIVGAPALKVPPARKVTWSHNVQYVILTLGGRQVVTWRNNNHTCVLSAPRGAVSTHTLQQLAESSG
jgi:anti-sigma factor RsiW